MYSSTKTLFFQAGYQDNQYAIFALISVVSLGQKLCLFCFAALRQVNMLTWPSALKTLILSNLDFLHVFCAAELRI